MFNQKTILITGGTGTVGQALVRFFLDKTAAKKVIVFSRDEHKQYVMQREIPDSRLRFFLGDIRDLDRLQRAFHGVDIVVHAAALKQVPAMEYNPFEGVQTNILGTKNVIDAAITQNVSKSLLISTDKAADPASLYGATKLCAERLFTSANFYGAGMAKFSTLRFGNVIGSRGSIIETLLSEEGQKSVNITDPEATRFWMGTAQVAESVCFALEQMEGGELFIPKMASMKLIDVIEAIAPKAARSVVGRRPGDKLHEILLTKHEAPSTIDLGKFFVIIPEYLSQNFESNYAKYFQQGKKIQEGFSFESDTNKEWLTSAQLVALSAETVKKGRSIPGAIDVIVAGRMGSSRLPGKTLMTFGDGAVLDQVVKQLRRSRNIRKVIVATTTLPKDDAIAEHCRNKNYDCFRGSEEGLLERFYKAAEHFGSQIIVRSGADNPFVDIEEMDKMIEMLVNDGLSYIGNHKQGIPIGLGCEVFTFSALARAYFDARSPEEKEHVTLYFYSHPEIFRQKEVPPEPEKKMEGARLTLDTKEDYDLLTRVEKILRDKNLQINTKNILDCFRADPSLKNINKNVVQKALAGK